jgi:hypothetical protein
MKFLLGKMFVYNPVDRTTIDRVADCLEHYIRNEEVNEHNF